MNRRGFLSGIIAAAIAPNFLKGAARQWRRTEELWIPNPNYVNATHEVEWLCSGDMFSNFDTAFLPSGEKLLFHRMPTRFTLNNENYEIQTTR